MATVSVVIEMIIEKDEEEDFYRWNGDYRVLSNDIPKSHRIGVAESIAQTDKGDIDSVCMTMEAVTKSGLQQGRASG